MTVYEQCEKCKVYFPMDGVNYFSGIGNVCIKCGEKLTAEKDDKTNEKEVKENE